MLTPARRQPKQPVQTDDVAEGFGQFGFRPSGEPAVQVPGRPYDPALRTRPYRPERFRRTDTTVPPPVRAHTRHRSYAPTATATTNAPRTQPPTTSDGQCTPSHTRVSPTPATEITATTMAVRHTARPAP
jgi:hypothetical protein